MNPGTKVRLTRTVAGISPGTPGVLAACEPSALNGYDHLVDFGADIGTLCLTGDELEVAS
jgi:hypothetical protein